MRQFIKDMSAAPLVWRVYMSLVLLFVIGVIGYYIFKGI